MSGSANRWGFRWCGCGTVGSEGIRILARGSVVRKAMPQWPSQDFAQQYCLFVNIIIFVMRVCNLQASGIHMSSPASLATRRQINTISWRKSGFMNIITRNTTDPVKLDITQVSCKS
jgi:hypothetical protein